MIVIWLYDDIYTLPHLKSCPVNIYRKMSALRTLENIQRENLHTEVEKTNLLKGIWEKPTWIVGLKDKEVKEQKWQ